MQINQLVVNQGMAKMAYEKSTEDLAQALKELWPLDHEVDGPPPWGVKSEEVAEGWLGEDGVLYIEEGYDPFSEQGYIIGMVPKNGDPYKPAWYVGKNTDGGHILTVARLFQERGPDTKAWEWDSSDNHKGCHNYEHLCECYLWVAVDMMMIPTQFSIEDFAVFGIGLCDRCLESANNCTCLD